MNSVTDNGRKTLWQVFAIPLWLALACGVGLVAALLGDGPLDWLSWLMLVLPVAVTVWALRYRRIVAAGRCSDPAG